MRVEIEATRLDDTVAQIDEALLSIDALAVLQSADVTVAFGRLESLSIVRQCSLPAL